MKRTKTTRWIVRATVALSLGMAALSPAKEVRYELTIDRQAVNDACKRQS